MKCTIDAASLRASLKAAPKPVLMIAASCVVLITTVALHGTVQVPSSPTTTTMSGVYTAAQADRGEQTYMNVCVGCHPAGTYAGPDFRLYWKGSSVSDLFNLLHDTMPKSDPGALPAADYAQVLAYLLKINGAPAGKTELPADSNALKKIIFAFPPKAN